MKEFFNHVRKYQATHAGDHDPRKIFEAWAIQKIAALQYTVLQLGDAINELQHGFGGSDPFRSLGQTRRRKRTIPSLPREP